jgi:hypothetical protein
MGRLNTAPAVTPGMKRHRTHSVLVIEFDKCAIHNHESAKAVKHEKTRAKFYWFGGFWSLIIVIWNLYLAGSDLCKRKPRLKFHDGHCYLHIVTNLIKQAAPRPATGLKPQIVTHNLLSDGSF